LKLWPNWLSELLWLCTTTAFGWAATAPPRQLSEVSVAADVAAVAATCVAVAAAATLTLGSSVNSALAWTGSAGGSVCRPFDVARPRLSTSSLVCLFSSTNWPGGTDNEEKKNVDSAACLSGVKTAWQSI